MLKSLYVKNYAIIDELNVDFSSGFNVFTGETGAGKSLIAGALSYLIKGKADTSVVRNGNDKAIIEGVFTIDDYMRPVLDDAGIDYEDELIVRRVISSDNHNSIRINQMSVTLAFLSALFEEHIDIHSQKDSQYLLNRRNHLRLLDRYSSDSELLENYIKDFDEYDKCAKEYDDLINNTYNEAELDFYRYDLKELEEAELDPEEENELENKEKRYKSAEKYLNSLGTAVELFDGDEGIKEKLTALTKSLNLDDSDVDKIRDRIDDLYYSLEDEIGKLHGILNGFEDEDLDIDRIEERLYTYSRLKRKHNLDTEGLIRKKNELKEKIAFFEDRDFVLGEKKKALDELYEKAKKTAQELSSIRQENAGKLEKDIIVHCNDLMLENAVFKVMINDKELSRNGADDVEFFVSMNKGEDVRPLRNVASGGEISRLMLALKTVFTSLSETSLVIFDEIDTGVSGKVALAIGQKMAEIAEKTQVLAITHLAAVAACADSHYFISKSDDDGYSKTNIRKLDHDEIINELALISSSENSEAALQAAEELYTSAQTSVKK